MMNIYENSNNEKIIKIFNLHPELAIEKNLTSFSSKEQTGAKLNDCSKEEFEEMLRYVFNEKFNFLLIDTNEDFKNMYHKNLNKRLIFPHMEEEEQ